MKEFGSGRDVIGYLPGWTEETYKNLMKYLSLQSNRNVTAWDSARTG
jgi:hypothetical protein